MSQHTPGPWRVNELYAPEHKDHRPTPYILDSQNRHVAAALNGDPSITNEERVANARLIAAAPRLLAELESAAGALEAAAKVLAGNNCHLPSLANLIDGHAMRARAASAKAKGGLPEDE